MKPSVGRIVHLKLDSITHCIPAMIVRVWSGTTCNLRLFPDGSSDPKSFGSNDHLANDWQTSVVEGDANNTWHWPERED